MLDVKLEVANELENSMTSCFYSEDVNVSDTVKNQLCGLLANYVNENLL